METPKVIIEHMVGHIRYQPKKLRPIFGYDNLYRSALEFELAGMDVLAEIGIIPEADYKLLTPEIRAQILAIDTTTVDEAERSGGGHDIIALGEVAKKFLPPPLRRWWHMMFTSYDPLGTAMALDLLRAYQRVILPQINEVIIIFAAKVREHADTKQMAHTHLQPALPITAGFWLATILSRVVHCAAKIDQAADALVGKVSGAVGAKNAQVLMGMPEKCGGTPFDVRVLAKLGLKPAKITTQVPPPEPVSEFLFACMELTQAFAQLGRDCRILMMREIGQVEEAAAGTSTASSAMSGKIANPRYSESNEGMGKLAKWSFQLVLDCYVNDLQRSLVDSACYRFFPLTVIFLGVQLENLLKVNKATQLPFLAGLVINREACMANLKQFGPGSMGEAVHTVLAYFGYEKDAHKLVNKVAAPAARKSGHAIINEVIWLAAEDKELYEVLQRIPAPIMTALGNPESYTGDAAEQALAIATEAEKHVARF